MAKAGSIRGNQDGPNGENETYTIQGRGTVTRRQLVKEVRSGLHHGYHIYTVNNVSYVKAKPNDRTQDNINKS